MGDEIHDITVTLARWAKRTDVAMVAEWAAEATNNETDIRAAPNGVLCTDEDAERFIWSCLTKPWFEVIEQFRNLLYFA